MENHSYKNKKLEIIRETQFHNFLVYLTSICDVDAINADYNECLSSSRSPKNAFPSLKEKQNQNECYKKYSEYESCLIIHKQLTTIFHTRQESYLKEKFN